MGSFNKVILAGNLTRDPVVRMAGSTGLKVADLGLAVSERFRDRQSGEVKESTCFVDLSVWGKNAEIAERYLRKGRNVLVEGRLQNDEWTTEKGEKRSRLRVRADRLVMLGASTGSAGVAPGAASAGLQPSQPGRSESFSSAVPPSPDASSDEDGEDLPF